MGIAIVRPVEYNPVFDSFKSIKPQRALIVWAWLRFLLALKDVASESIFWLKQ